MISEPRPKSTRFGNDDGTRMVSALSALLHASVRSVPAAQARQGLSLQCPSVRSVEMSGSGIRLSSRRNGRAWSTRRLLSSSSLDPSTVLSDLLPENTD